MSGCQSSGRREEAQAVVRMRMGYTDISYAWIRHRALGWGAAPLCGASQDHDLQGDIRVSRLLVRVVSNAMWTWTAGYIQCSHTGYPYSSGVSAQRTTLGFDLGMSAPHLKGCV